MGYILKTKTAVLSELMRARDRTVSGGALSLSLGLTRQAVWKAVKALREDGYVIESIPQRGYRYISPPKNDLDPTLIETLLLDCPWVIPSYSGRASIPPRSRRRNWPGKEPPRD